MAIPTPTLSSENWQLKDNKKHSSCHHRRNCSWSPVDEGMFFTKEHQPIDVGRMTEWGNHYFATSNETVNFGSTITVNKIFAGYHSIYHPTDVGDHLIMGDDATERPSRCRLNHVIRTSLSRSGTTTQYALPAMMQ